MTGSLAVYGRPAPALEEPATNSQLSRVVPLSYATDNVLASLRRIAELMRLPDNWDSYGSIPIQPAAARRAIQVLLAAETEFPPPPRIVPVSGGGLQIEWAYGNRELEIEMLPDGSVEFLLAGDEQTLEWRLPLHQVDSFVPNLVSWLSGTRAYAAASR